MHPSPKRFPDENRFADHLRHVGYTTSETRDPHGWRHASHSFGQELCFRVGADLLNLYAEHSACGETPESFAVLLETVNALNASQWLIRCTAIPPQGENSTHALIRLQANIPLGMTDIQLGECLYTWLRESAHVERAVDRHQWQMLANTIAPGSDDTPSE